MAGIGREPERLLNREVEIAFDPSYSGFKESTIIPGFIRAVQPDGKSADVELVNSFNMNDTEIKHIQIKPRHERDTLYRLSRYIPWRKHLIVNVISLSPENKPSFIAIGKVSAK